MSLALRLLALSACLIFFGRGYQYLFWDGPLRVLLWDEKFMTPLVTGVFGREWSDYATDPAVVGTIGIIQRLIGGLWWACVPAAAWLLRRQAWWQRALMWAGIFFLLVHALLEMKDHFYHLAQFFEYGIQLGVPLLLLLFTTQRIEFPALLTGAKIAIAVTFAAHGLYALGVYPVPGNFVDMTIGIFGCSEAAARTYLQVAGILDLILAVAVFIPGVSRYALLYGVLWGLLTALARMAYGWRIDYVENYLHQYAYQTIFRLPHGLLPLTVWWLLRTRLAAASEPGLAKASPSP